MILKREGDDVYTLFWEYPLGLNPGLSHQIKQNLYSSWSPRCLISSFKSLIKKFSVVQKL